MGLLDWFRRKRKRPIVADKEGKSPYDQAKKIIQKQKIVKEMIKKAEKESEVFLEKFEVETAPLKRARTTKGRYKGDDKSTTDVNEAWVGGKAPHKPIAKKTQVKKKK